MIDLIMLRERVLAVEREISLTEEVRQWADGSYRPASGELLPAPASREGYAAWRRAVQRVAGLGPRIVSSYLTAAVHDVNWGGSSARLDERLTGLDLHGLARQIAEDLLVAGVAAGYVYEHPQHGLRLGLLGGYLMPYLDPWDRAIVTGLYQASRVRPVQSPPRWWVRVWDVEEGKVREWRDLNSPIELARPPAQTLSGLSPRWRWWALGEAGLPTSPMVQALPILRSIMALSLMMARLEEMAAYPVPVFSPDTEAQEIGPGLPIRGEFRWASPGNLGELREQFQHWVGVLRDFLALPGGALGSQTPSGEALREANVRFRASVTYLAQLTSALLTELVADYADAVGTDPVPVSVVTSPALERDDHIGRIISLYKEGLIPIRVALMEIQPYLPMLTDEVLDEYARRMEGVSSPEQLARLLGG